jgi:hypothetical protein
VGVERVIRFSGEVPGWPTVAMRLAEVGEKPVVRMIDGQPAFPEEVPEPGWQELRVGLSGGMITLRRDGSEVRVVTWGASDLALTRSWDRLCWAVAAASSGIILTADGPQDAETFRIAVLGG